MKKNIIERISLYSILLLLMFTVACGKMGTNEEANNNGNGGSNGDQVFTNLSLKIMDKDNNPLSGVAVDVYGATGTTDGGGVLTMNQAGIPVENAGRMSVKLEKEGYFENTIAIIPIINGSTFCEAILLEKELAGTIDNGSGGTVSDQEESVTVDVQGGSYERTDGSSYNGNVNIYIVYINPNDENFALQMPGGPDMSAVDPNAGGEGVLQSFGAIYMSAETETGDDLEPVDAASFDYCIAIPQGLVNSAPQTIDIWLLNNSGVWEKFTTATKVGSQYCFNTNKSGRINCDIFNRSAIVEGTVCNDLMEISPFERINIGQRIAYADAEGKFSALVPANKELIISTEYCSKLIPSLTPSTIHTTTIGCDDDCIQGAQGNPRFNLKFDGNVDFDFYVKDPNGEVISYSSSTSSSGGQLDVDCICCEHGSENIYWENGSGPSGTYEYWVQFFSACNDQSSTFTITVSNNGIIVDTKTGSLSTVGEESQHWTYVH